MHHIFIVNPTAGKGRALKMVEKIKAFFKDFDESYEIKLTEMPGHAKQLAKEATMKHETLRLYSVGGDGTLNEIVNGMIGSSAELGIIPCGTGNDTVRSVYSVTDPSKLIEILPSSASKLIDSGKVNEKYFINTASVGFDADVASKSNFFKRIPFIPGSIAYIMALFWALIKLGKYSYSVKIKSNETILHLKKEFLMTILANGSFYGGGMKPAPKAKIDDGVLDFCLVDKISRLKIFKLFPAFKEGLHESMKEVTMERGTSGSIESQIPFTFGVDGEVDTATKIEFELLPNSLRIIVPA